MKTCYIDIEGDELYPIEIGLVLVDREKQEILDAVVLYGRVCNFEDFGRAQRYCHGMSRQFLEIYGYGPWELTQRVRKVICEDWKPDEIVGNGFDSKRYLNHQANVLTLFRNCELPPWKLRDELLCHQHVYHMKANCQWVGEKACCHWQDAHPFPIQTTSMLKQAHGAHCALYDATEVALYDNPILCHKL